MKARLINYQDLFRSWRSVSGPRLICYLDGRVELNGAVLENWLSKQMNLFLDDWQIEPDDRLTVALPAHWRSLLWILSAQFCGIEICQFTPEEDQSKTGDKFSSKLPGDHVYEPDIWDSVQFQFDEHLLAQVEKSAISHPGTRLVTDRPDLATYFSSQGQETYLVDRHPFAWQYRGTLPEAVSDANAQVLMQSDQLIYSPECPGITLEIPSVTVTSYPRSVLVPGQNGPATGLAGGADPATQLPRAVRYNVAVVARKLADLTQLGQLALSIWLTGGNLILIKENQITDENLLMAESVAEIWSV